MIEIAATIEHHLLMPFSLARSATRLPISFAAATLPPVAFAFAEAFSRRTRRHQRHAFGIVDHLRIDMRDAAEHGQTRPLGRAAAASCGCGCERARGFRFSRSCESFTSYLRSRRDLADLLLQHFARIADALVLVRIRFAQRANIGRHLAEQLLVVTRSEPDGSVCRSCRSTPSGSRTSIGCE